MAEPLEDLVVRMLGDDSDYRQMIDSALSSTQKAAHQIEAAAGEVTGFMDSIKGFAGQLVGLLASVGAADWLRDAFNNFAEAENISLDSMLSWMPTAATLSQYAPSMTSLPRPCSA